MIDYLAAFVNTDGTAFPNTLAVNVTAPGAGDGTEFIAAMVNDAWGARQALMDRAGLLPDGVDEAPGTSQYMLAMQRAFAIGAGIGVTYWKNDTPAAFGDRVLLLTGQVILIATYQALVDATWVGAADNATAPAFYRTSDAGGTTRDAAGNYLVLPDTRGLSLKNIGDATISARVKTGPVSLGSVQEDQGQGFKLESLTFTGGIRGVSASGTGVNTSGQWRFDAALTGNTNNIILTGAFVNDGTNGDPRTGLNTRDSSLGTRFGITY